ncbi:Isochorismatase-like protein [Xylogone sp. PMI_703]|nr:Isochorismatase-like protein [Xylogone sp. PMI_703]
MSTLTTMFNQEDPSTPGHYGPSQTALLLLDFHFMFVEKLGGPEAVAALNVAAKMRTWAKSQGIIQVIHCLVDPNSVPFSTCKEASRFADIAAAMRLNGGEEPAELLEDNKEDVTFGRRLGHVSALKSPGLEDFLQDKGIKSLILTGLSTSGCVLRTAMAASDAEYIVTVISDGLHEKLIEKLLGHRGYVTTAAEFQEYFTKVTGKK